MAISLFTGLFATWVTGWLLRSRKVGVQEERSKHFDWYQIAYMLGLGLGIGSGLFSLNIFPSWPPASALDRMITLVLPAIVIIEIISAFRCLTNWTISGLRVILALAMARVLLHGSVYLAQSSDAWTTLQSRLFFIACPIVLIIGWVVLSRQAGQAGAMSVAISIALAIQASGIAIMLGGYLKGGSAAIPLAAALIGPILGLMLTSCLQSNSQHDAAALSSTSRIGLVGLSSLLIVGHFFGRLSTVHAVFLGLAPLFGAAVEFLPRRWKKPTLVGSIRLILVLVPLIWVCVQAKWEFDLKLGRLL